MISTIQGKVKKKKQTSVLVDVNGIWYEVMIPPAVMKTLGASLRSEEPVNFVTYHYHQVDPSRTIPTLIGFTNEIEREFFSLFITVSGVGPKAACRALSLPISTIAHAIDKGDVGVLKSLPGIGERRAREIVAKLQGRVGKFGLIQDGTAHDTQKITEDIKQEAVDVLLQLQYRKHEAGEMVAKAISRNPNASSCEDILNEVYKWKNKT